MHIHSTRMAVLAVVSALIASGNPAAAMDDISPGTAPILDLPTALRLAAEQPALRARTHDVAASGALVDQAGRLPNPALSYLREGQDDGARTTTIQLSQPIELGGKRAARVALAQGALQAARGELAARRLDVRASVIAAYYEVAVDGHKLALARELTDLAGKSVDVAHKRVAAGKVSPLDETKARLAAVDADTVLKRATADLAIARTKLGALIGRPAAAIVLPALPGVPADAPPEIAPLERLLALAQGAAPLQRARNGVAVQEAQTRVERAARVPDLTLTVGTQRDDQVGRRQAVFGVSAPLPLFNRNDGNLRAALQRTDQARDELAAAEVNTAADLAGAYTRYETAKSEAALLARDVVPSAHAAYTLTLTGFEYGKFPFLDVLDAQRTWFQAQSRQWDSLLDAWRAYADIERLTGATDTRN